MIFQEYASVALVFVSAFHQSYTRCRLRISNNKIHFLIMRFEKMIFLMIFTFVNNNFKIYSEKTLYIDKIISTATRTSYKHA
jgi:hypothetical protein